MGRSHKKVKLSDGTALCKKKIMCMFCLADVYGDITACTNCFNYILQTKIDVKSIEETVSSLKLSLMHSKTEPISVEVFVDYAKFFFAGSRKGSTKCMIYLGLIFFKKLLGYQDLRRCIYLWQNAMKLGDLNAHYLLGACHYRGIFLEKSEEKALDLWSYAAMKGHKHSQETLIGQRNIILRYL
jgi:TPR repeat protein